MAPVYRKGASTSLRSQTCLRRLTSASCRVDATSAMPQRAAADHSGPSPEATVWLAEAFRRPVSPGAKTFAPIRSCLSSSHQAMPCRQTRSSTGGNRRLVHQPVDLRQILQCVGQIRTGSFVQTLNQMSDFRRHGKPHGTMPTLLLSPSSRSQFSGASRIGSQWLGTGSSRISAECHHGARILMRRGQPTSQSAVRSCLSA
jgi:hypothetical protein